MKTKEQKALKLALDFLLSRRMGAEELIVEIQEALTQPAQEPVAWAKALHYPECWDTAAYPELRDAVHEALAWAGCSVCAPPAEQPALDAAFLRQVLSIAIAELYEHYKDDVLRVFTLNDLQIVVDLSESLRPQQVEDIYKRAWTMLATPPAAQPAPVQYGSPELQAMIVARAIEKDRAAQRTWDSADDGRGGLKIRTSVAKFADLIRADERKVIADLLEHGYTDDEGHHIQYAEEIRARGDK